MKKKSILDYLDYLLFFNEAVEDYCKLYILGLGVGIVGSDFR